MPKTLSHSLFLRLAKSEKLITALQDLHNVSGMVAVFTNAEGKTIHSYPRFPDKGICQVLFDEGQKKQCQACLDFKILPPCEGRSSRGCPVGLLEIAYTLSVEEQHIGTISLQYFRDKESGENLCKDTWIAMAREGSKVKWVDFLKDWEQYPQLEEKQISSYGRYLKLTSHDLIDSLDKDSAITGKMQVLPSIVSHACTFIRNHFADSISIKDVALHCGVSAEYLSRLFKSTTNLKLQDYLTETRLNEACHLLMNSEMNIADISNEVGYSTLSRFNHNFKSYTGMTPSQWKRRNATYSNNHHSLHYTP